MTTAELARNVRYIEITTRKAVTATFAGEYRSAFKGQGMDFDEVREYIMGDDIRAIDWNVTARTGVPHTKRFREERELTVMLLVDLSASGSFGSSRSKNLTAAEVCALLAFSAIKNNDRVGLLIFTDRLELYIPPRKGSTHVLRLIRELLAFRPEGAGTDIRSALETFARMFKRRAVVFLVSDFLDTGYESALQVAGRRHDLIALWLTDPLERELPPVGLVELEDAETGGRLLVDTSSPRSREAVEQAWERRAGALQGLCSGAGIDLIRIISGTDYVGPLSRFFLARERRKFARTG
ncbi:MAG: DUF58 domain-containing protein [Spirochaetota bacterium]